MSARRGGGAGGKGGTRNAVTYSLGDIVLGKVRGYAPWPGIVVDPDAVAEKVAAERPAGKKTTFYCVRFFPMGDHAWLVEKDMSRLQPHEISAYLSEPKKKGGKSGEILEAYKIAQDPTEWLKKKEAEAAEEEDEEANAEVDQLEHHDSEVASTASAPTTSKSKNRSSNAAASSSRKRKREAGGESASAVSSKAKKQPKTSAAKKDKDESASAVSKRGGAKGGKRNGTASSKSKAMVESEDEGDHGRSASGAEDHGGSSSKKAAGSPPPAKKAKKDAEGDEAKDDPDSVKVRDWRHKLQKTFLSGKAPPKDEDMPDLDKLFKTVEDCENITIEQLQFSKIGKVMRHIAALTEPQVPRDTEYKFRERAKALVERWQGILSASKTAGGASTPGGGKANGSSSSPGKDTTHDNENKSSKKAAKVAAADDEKKEEEDAEGERDEDDDEGEREEGDGGVTEGTAAINLNGKDADMIDDTTAPQGSTAAATESAKDVDMAEG